MERKPFHESIVDAINSAATSEEMTTLGALIKMTKVPKGHDEIIDAWCIKCGALGLNDPDDVINDVLDQKPPAAAIAA